MRKTREQVWRELEVLGEDEVRARLAARPAAIEEPALVHEWLAQRERVSAALAETSSDLARRRGRGWSPMRVVGSAVLIGVAAVGLAFLLARRKR